MALKYKPTRFLDGEAMHMKTNVAVASGVSNPTTIQRHFNDPLWSSLLVALVAIVQLEATKASATTITGFAASSMTVFVNPFALTVAAVDRVAGYG